MSIVNTDNLITHVPVLFNTNTTESLKIQINDVIDFLIDVHTSAKIKVSCVVL